MMDFTFCSEALELRDRVDEFVRTRVIPLEARVSQEGGLAPDVVRDARRRAKEAGIWAPQLPRELGGQGLKFVDLCPTFEAAGQSLLGPICLGCAAPDEGNAHLLHLIANDQQMEKYLRPLAAGEIRSTFAMTEPAPGAGSDPTMMKTRAVRDGRDWVINGQKWFASGAQGADFAIVCAVTNPDVPPKDGCTLFLVDADTPGYKVVRTIPVMGSGLIGGHCEIRLADCRVPAGQILGQEGRGFAHMQERLGPARLTHCMRWLGVAQRALDIACARAKEREAFGKRLAEHQAVQWMLADSDTEIHAGRLMTYEAAWQITTGRQARRETSMCKVFVAETVNRVIDRAIQVCGGLGVTEDIPLVQFYQEARSFRIYDGPSEVHRMIIARGLLKDKK